MKRLVNLPEKQTLDKAWGSGDEIIQRANVSLSNSVEAFPERLFSLLNCWQ
jgi:hypothetical protein